MKRRVSLSLSVLFAINLCVCGIACIPQSGSEGAWPPAKDASGHDSAQPNDVDNAGMWMDLKGLAIELRLPGDEFSAADQPDVVVVLQNKGGKHLKVPVIDGPEMLQFVDLLFLGDRGHAYLTGYGGPWLNPAVRPVRIVDLLPGDTYTAKVENALPLAAVAAYPNEHFQVRAIYRDHNFGRPYEVLLSESATQLGSIVVSPPVTIKQIGWPEDPDEELLIRHNTYQGHTGAFFDHDENWPARDNHDRDQRDDPHRSVADGLTLELRLPKARVQASERVDVELIFHNTGKAALTIPVADGRRMLQGLTFLFLNQLGYADLMDYGSVAERLPNAPVRFLKLAPGMSHTVKIENALPPKTLGMREEPWHVYAVYRDYSFRSLAVYQELASDDRTLWTGTAMTTKAAFMTVQWSEEDAEEYFKPLQEFFEKQK